MSNTPELRWTASAKRRVSERTRHPIWIPRATRPARFGTGVGIEELMPHEWRTTRKEATAVAQAWIDAFQPKVSRQ